MNHCSFRNNEDIIGADLLLLRFLAGRSGLSSLPWVCHSDPITVLTDFMDPVTVLAGFVTVALSQCWLTFWFYISCSISVFHSLSGQLPEYTLFQDKTSTFVTYKSCKLQPYSLQMISICNYEVSLVLAIGLSTMGKGYLSTSNRKIREALAFSMNKGKRLVLIYKQ